MYKAKDFNFFDIYTKQNFKKIEYFCDSKNQNESWVSVKSKKMLFPTLRAKSKETLAPYDDEQQ